MTFSSSTSVERIRKTWHNKYTLTGYFYSKVSPPQALFLMIADVGIFMSIIIMIYYVMGKIFLQPIQRGFYCNDMYIKNPLYSNTVPTTYLLLITLGGPFIVIFGSLLLKHTNGNVEVLIKNSKRIITHICKESCFVFLDYILGFGILTISLEFMKCATGRLRPNFLSLCRPDLTLCESDPNAYIEDYTCNPILPKYGRNSKMSFPSGHAAASVFAQLFVYFYLRYIFDKCDDNIKKCKPVIMFKRICLLFFNIFAIFCSISRIWDYWHFPSDVLGGVLTALVFFYVTLRKYLKRTQKTNNIDENSSTLK